MSVRLADRSFQCPVGIAKNMLVEVGKFTFRANFVILKMEEYSKVPLILERPFLHTADAVIRVKQKQLNLGVGTERMIFKNESAIKHSYSNDDTCFRTILKEKLFAEFDEFMAMTVDENSKSEFDTEEPPFKKITFNTDYKIKTSLENPPTYLELKPLPDNLKYIPIDPMDQERTTFTCPFRTYAYRRVPFGLCNAPATFQRCMLAIFHDMIEESVKVFMDDFFVFGSSFGHCLNNLDKMLQRWEDAHLVLLDRKGTENVAADHLSRIEKEETSDDSEVDDNFPGETLYEELYHEEEEYNDLREVVTPFFPKEWNSRAGF
ncbi:reverse transcriptase domain-containing protein [Tanacetum coccineum]